MDFKFFRGSENGLSLFRLEPTQILTLRGQRYENVQYCFQFDDEEPQVFGTGSEDLTLRIEPRADGVITFQHQGRRFKIFAREN